MRVAVAVAQTQGYSKGAEKEKNTHDFLTRRLTSARLDIRLTRADPGVGRAGVDEEGVLCRGTADAD